MDHQEIQNTIGAYCLGALSESEQQALRNHLQSGCAECLAILRETQLIVEGLAFTVKPIEPPADMKEKLLAALDKDSVSFPEARQVSDTETGGVAELLKRAKRPWMRASWTLAFATALILIISGMYSQNLKTKIFQLQQQLQLSEKVVSDLRIELSRQQRILQVIQSDEIRIVNMQGQSTSPRASGKVYWNPQQNRAVFLAFNLPLPPTGKEYQLWMIRGGTQPVDAGVFTIDSQGNGISTIDTISDSANLAAFAVTLEPRGGVPQPTGEMYLVGTVTQG